VEREFRKRIAGNKQNDGESGSVRYYLYFSIIRSISISSHILHIRLLYGFIIVAVRDLGIVFGKQKLYLIFAKQNVIDFTRFSKLTMWRASKAKKVVIDPLF
jgi:hypothetical protein